MLPGLIHGGLPSEVAGVWELVDIYTGTTINPNFPSGLQDGDVAVVLLGENRGSQSAPAALTNWDIALSRNNVGDEPLSCQSWRIAYRALTASLSGASMNWVTTSVGAREWYMPIFRNTMPGTPARTALITSGTGNMSAAFSGAPAPPIALFGFARSVTTATTFTPSGGSGTWVTEQRENYGMRAGLAFQCQVVPTDASCTLTSNSNITRHAGYII